MHAKKKKDGRSSKVVPPSFRACPIRASGFLEINITLLSPHPELLLARQNPCRDPRNNAASWVQFAIPNDKMCPELAETEMYPSHDGCWTEMVQPCRRSVIKAVRDQSQHFHKSDATDTDTAFGQGSMALATRQAFTKLLIHSHPTTAVPLRCRPCSTTNLCLLSAKLAVGLC